MQTKKAQYYKGFMGKKEKNLSLENAWPEKATGNCSFRLRCKRERKERQLNSDKLNCRQIVNFGVGQKCHSREKRQSNRAFVRLTFPYRFETNAI